jgi:hypothetical protein
LSLLISLKKFDNKPSVVHFLRSDESETWQSYGNQSDFFPLHDLTHYAVETELGFSRAFYGMISDGREVTDFGPGDAVRMDPEATYAEILVGLIMSADSTGTYLTNSEILGLFVNEVDRLGLASLRLDTDQLSKIRSLRDSLIAYWKFLPAGQTMTLEFPRSDEG